jgi:DTW domain-containing protein YfiP
MDILQLETFGYLTGRYLAKFSVCEDCGMPLGICLCDDEDEDEDTDEGF